MLTFEQYLFGKREVHEDRAACAEGHKHIPTSVVAVSVSCDTCNRIS